MANQCQTVQLPLLVDDEGRPLDRSKMTEEHSVLYDLITKGDSKKRVNKNV